MIRRTINALLLVGAGVLFLQINGCNGESNARPRVTKLSVELTANAPEPELRYPRDWSIRFGANEYRDCYVRNVLVPDLQQLRLHWEEQLRSSQQGEAYQWTDWDCILTSSKYLVVGRSAGTRIDCYDIETGELLWKQQRNVSSELSPELIKNDILYTSGHSGLSAIDLATGDVRWKCVGDFRGALGHIALSYRGMIISEGYRGRHKKNAFVLVNEESGKIEASIDKMGSAGVYGLSLKAAGNLVIFDDASISVFSSDSQYSVRQTPTISAGWAWVFEKKIWVESYDEADDSVSLISFDPAFNKQHDIGVGKTAFSIPVVANNECFVARVRQDLRMWSSNGGGLKVLREDFDGQIIQGIEDHIVCIKANRLFCVPTGGGEDVTLLELQSDIGTAVVLAHRIILITKEGKLMMYSRKDSQGDAAEK